MKKKITYKWPADGVFVPVINDAESTFILQVEEKGRDMGWLEKYVNNKFAKRISHFFRSFTRTVRVHGTFKQGNQFEPTHVEQFAAYQFQNFTDKISQKCGFAGLKYSEVRTLSNAELQDVANQFKPKAPVEVISKGKASMDKFAKYLGFNSSSEMPKFSVVVNITDKAIYAVGNLIGRAYTKVVSDIDKGFTKVVTAYKGSVPVVPIEAVHDNSFKGKLLRAYKTKFSIEDIVNFVYDSWKKDKASYVRGVAIMFVSVLLYKEVRKIFTAVVEKDRNSKTSKPGKKD
jgi:hypothetical protein